jgi:hypothetical protein
MENIELTAEIVQSKIFKPKNEISAKMVKLQVKVDALESTIIGLKSIDQINNLKEWIKTIR